MKKDKKHHQSASPGSIGFIKIDKDIPGIIDHPIALSIYVCLKQFANYQTGQAYPSYATIMKHTGINSPTTVNKYLNHIVSCGLLRIENRMHPNGKKQLTSNLYTVFDKPSPLACYITIFHGKHPETEQATPAEPVSEAAPHPTPRDGVPPLHEMEYPTPRDGVPPLHEMGYPTPRDGVELKSVKNTNCIEKERERERENERKRETPSPSSSASENTFVSTASVSTPVSTTSSMKETEEIKEAYGEYKNVYLTASELTNLVNLFTKPVVMDFIRQLDNRMAESDFEHAKYASKKHAVTLKIWIEKEQKQPNASGNSASQGDYTYQAPQYKPQKVNRFCNFQQRDWDFEALDEMQREYMNHTLKNTPIRLTPMQQRLMEEQAIETA